MILSCQVRSMLTSLMRDACVCAATFYPVSHTAAYLMVPLLAWVSYATALNATILDMNRRKRE